MLVEFLLMLGLLTSTIWGFAKKLCTSFSASITVCLALFINVILSERIRFHAASYIGLPYDAIGIASILVLGILFFLISRKLAGGMQVLCKSINIGILDRILGVIFAVFCFLALINSYQLFTRIYIPGISFELNTGFKQLILLDLKI